MITVTIVLAPRFPFLSLAICTESLRVANRELGGHAFGRQIVTLDGAAALSSSGLRISADAALGEVSFAPAAILLSSYQPEEAATHDVLTWLRYQNRRGALLACVDTGAYLFAKAGLLGGRHIVAHRETLPAYKELFDDAILSDEPFAFDGRIASSAGGMATMDMMLKIIAHFHSQPLAERVAYVLNYRPLDPTTSAAGSAREGTIARIDKRLGHLVEIMQANLADPLPLAQLCNMADVDASTARRLFLRCFKQSPGRYYMGLRLEHARSLLTNSALPIREIATMSGFADASAFSRAYRQRLGQQPSRSRRADPGFGSRE
jgi:AraC family carnitine catabolism transcriptional activator